MIKRDYDDLIHNCRMSYADTCCHCGGDFCESCDNRLLNDAANAIEELLERRRFPLWNRQRKSIDFLSALKKWFHRFSRRTDTERM